MNKLYKLTCYLSAIMLTCCTAEVQHEGNGPLPGDDDDDALKREVVLTLKNKLAVPQAGTKTGGMETKAIATAEENYIRSLDVYVFGSETEDGEYTFQELFYYRDDASLLTKSYAKPINLTAAGDNTTALLKLSKGLFVKLYCVANCTDFDAFIPDGGEDGAGASLFAYLVPLTQSAPGEPENVVTPGEPTEKVFLTLVTGFDLRMDKALTSPLAMAGSYTTPLDLTDFDNSARTQMSFKLTRLAARFDVINDATASKFTITSIAMGNARVGAYFFPIRPMDEEVTNPGFTLITSEPRPFDGNQANTGLQPGAFYCYPSPKEDEGYLILKGTYAVNQTQSQEVTYQIPFKPSNADEGSFLEVAYNHRYTIAITDADPYHLDFTLTVADWADDGSIDEYTPGNEVDASVKVDIATDPDKKVVFDEATNTVTMPVSTTSTFDLSASQGLSLTKSYMGTPEDQQYDWLVVSEPVATKAATEGNYKYTFTVNPDYHGINFPVALLRFKNTATGKSQLMRVAPETTPTVTTGQTYTLAAATDLTVPSIDITVDCAQGSTITGPDWLTYDKTEATTASATYRVSLVPNLDGFPTALPADQTITIANKAKPELKTDVTVSFTDVPKVTIANADATETDGSLRVSTAGKTLQVVAYAMFEAPVITTGYDAGFGAGQSWLPEPASPANTEIASNRRKFTYEIVIPATTGTDAAYQLYKGTVTATDKNSVTTSFTLWRGASNIPYPTKGYDGSEGGSPYYSAVHYEGYWWAPINVGAYEVAANGTDRKYAGNLYQWGRKVATYAGSIAKRTGPVMNADATDEFITTSSNQNNWLSPSNENLWDNGGAKTTYDPCPEGWRVPNQTQLQTWNVDGNTFADYILTIPGTNDIALLLPITSYRRYNGDTITDSRDGGVYWGATVSSPYAQCASFNSANVVVKEGYRASGFSVRCVKE